MATEHLKEPAAISAVEDITIELSTKPAIRLWVGREKSDKKFGILGVPGFCKFMNTMESAIRKDDPYADYYYFQIEEAISDLASNLDRELQDIEDHISKKKHRKMTLPPVSSKEPLKLPIRFAAQTGFKITHQLLMLDEIVTRVLAANHIGILGQDDKHQIIKRLEQQFRAVLNLVFKYKYTGVTRDDIATNNQIGRKALKQMGELPDEFLFGDKRAQDAPPLPKKRRNTSKNNSTKDKEQDEVPSTDSEQSESAAA